MVGNNETELKLHTAFEDFSQIGKDVKGQLIVSNRQNMKRKTQIFKIENLSTLRRDGQESELSTRH